MTKMDEAVIEAALFEADKHPVATMSRITAFHRALRERGYAVVEIKRLEELATASVQGMAMIAAAQEG